jgi:hypothetical protein
MMSLNTSDVSTESSDSVFDVTLSAKISIVKKRLYASKIIKAGALLADTKMMLASWNIELSPSQNLDRFQQENIFGKASRVRIRDMLAIFRQRYLIDERITRALVKLSVGRLPAEALDRILYFHSAQSDPLLHDIVIEVIGETRRLGRDEITTSDVEEGLKRWVEEGKTAGNWSGPTVTRIAQGLLATLRDFGVLKGAVRKRLTPVYLPLGAFAYIAFYLQQKQASGERLISDPEWGLFFLSTEEVERFFLEAHQRGLLEYHAAGTVIRIEFPVRSIEEYASVIVERAH